MATGTFCVLEVDGRGLWLRGVELGFEALAVLDDLVVGVGPLPSGFEGVLDGVVFHAWVVEEGLGALDDLCALGDLVGGPFLVAGEFDSRRLHLSSPSGVNGG